MRNMKEMSKVRYSLLVLCAAAAFAFALSPMQAKADDIDLVGSTTGGFNTDTPALTDSLNGGELTFTGNAYFNNPTAGGDASLVLGSFFLSGSPTSYNYAGNTFTIDIDLTSPAGVGNPVSSQAQITGTVDQETGGVWVLNFNPGTQTVDFTGGSFDLTVNSVALTPGGSENLTAFVDNTTLGGGDGGSVPEPPTALLAGLGIAGVFLLLKNKKRLLLA